MQGGSKDDNVNRVRLGSSVDGIGGGDNYGVQGRCEETMINPSVIDAMFNEILALRRANGILRDRLHQCKRRNREDKVRIRNDYDKYIGELEMIRRFSRRMSE